MIYINLFGQEVDTEKVSKKAKKTNPMVLAMGPGPGDKRCKHCFYLYKKQFSKNYFKCQFRGDTNGPGTDHRVNWPTCSKFKPDTE